MTGLRSPWLLAVAPAMLCMTPILVPFISLQHRFLYHQDGSALTVLAALWVNLAVCWLLFALVLHLAHRARWLSVLFWVSFLCYAPLLLLRDYGALYYTTVPATAHRIALSLIAGFLAFLALGWRPLIAPRLSLLLSRLTGIFAFLSIGWIVTLGQLALYTVQARSLDRTPILHATSAAASSHPPRPRLVWIIMDELGYDPAFAQRFPGLALPAFDALAGQATQFTNAQAPGLFTEYVVPTLIMGHPAEHVTFTASGDLSYLNPHGKTRTLDPEDTVFADGLHAGYRTAIDGWHNPYCRLLAPVLDHCFWIARSDSATPAFDSRASFGSNLLGPARYFWANLRVPPDFLVQADRRDARLHVQDLNALLASADRTLADPNLGLVLIHLPVPHPAGIYDRHRGTITFDGPEAPSSYVDNLALADKVLAHLRDVLTARNEWDSSTVLVMGDHSWRTTMQWKGIHGWTAEDQVASHGGSFDPRPVYLLKLPGQQTGSTWNQAFPTLRTRALFDALMKGEVRTPADLQRWAATPAQQP